MIGQRITRVKGSAEPSSIWWRTDRGALIDFSAATGGAWTFGVVVGTIAAQSFATGAVTGAVGSGLGNKAADVPNLVIDWTAANLGALARGHYTISITATLGTVPRLLHLPLTIVDDVA